MELTVIGIVGIITVIIAEISKLAGLEGKYIPLQNLAVGLVAGIACYFLKIDGMNIITAILNCVIASFTAGGLYDLKKAGE